VQKKSEKKTVVVLLSVCAALFILWRAMPQPPRVPRKIEWKTYTAAAQEKAHQQGKPVMILFSAPW
jgi:hypothetical protein